MKPGLFLKEYSIILTSLERMAEGTCGGNSEKSICTWELMPRIQETLSEHIEHEEEFLFPYLSSAAREQHELEHKRLLRLLAKASYEFECGYGENLNAIVRQLLKELKEHHDKLERKAA